jgi:hypothetical protein
MQALVVTIWILVHRDLLPAPRCQELAAFQRALKTDQATLISMVLIIDKMME